MSCPCWNGSGSWNRSWSRDVCREREDIRGMDIAAELRTAVMGTECREADMAMRVKYQAAVMVMEANHQQEVMAMEAEPRTAVMAAEAESRTVDMTMEAEPRMEDTAARLQSIRRRRRRICSR